MNVVVLMSSYRGKPFIEQQICSILAQHDVSVRLLIRDDGSDDGTAELVADIARNDSRICCVAEENLGVVGSFFRLIELVEAGSDDFVALADQDDIWPSMRLAQQGAALAKVPSDVPALCFGAFSRIDEEGNPLLGGPILPPMPLLGPLLTENEVLGCSMVLNPAGFELVRSSVPPANRVFMHDWWIEQIIAHVGEVVRVDEVVTLYRQHVGNMVGSVNRAQEWRDRLERTWDMRGRHPLLSQVQELRDRFGDRMAEADLRRIDLLLRAGTGNLLDRLRLARESQFKRTRRSDDLYLRALLVGGYFRSQMR